MKKIRRLWQYKFVRNYCLLILSLTLLEVIFHLISGLTLLSWASLRIFFGLNILATFFSFLLSFLPRRVGTIFNIIFISFFSIYGIVQLGFKNYFSIYVSIASSSQAEAVTSYIWDFIKSFHASYYLIFIPLILLLIYYIFINKRVTFDIPKRKWDIYLGIIKYIEVLLLIFFNLGFYTTLKFDIFQNKMQTTTSLDLFKKPNNPSLLVSEFGYIGFGLLDIKEYFWPGEELDTEIDYNPDDLASNKHEVSLTFKNQLAIDNDIWKDIIEEEKNVNKNTLNKYFISKNPSKTNAYTGLFENKNLIVLMIESGSNLMLNKEYYPNIYKLYNEGWSWNNYYSPRNTCSTINNEFSNLTGLYTINNNCTATYYKNNTYFTSLFNLFNSKGYSTSSYHDHIDAYYPRTLIHKNLGSNKYYKVTDLNIKYSTSYGNWASDNDFINSYLKILDEKETGRPFMTFLTTVTSHMPYTDDCTYNSLYKDLFPTNYPNDVRAYMSKIKVVDDAIGSLLKGLEERSMLDDTVIVLFADHYPYGISKPNLAKAYGYDISKDNDSEKVPFIIYNPALEKTEFKEFTAHVNTTPTLANLFNLEFDSRLYLGSDVLDNAYESLVIFDDASWKNEYAFYDSSTNNINYYTEKVYTDEEILAINEKVSLKLKMSSLAIKSNYFNYLKEKLDSYLYTS